MIAAERVEMILQLLGRDAHGDLADGRRRGSSTFSKYSSSATSCPKRSCQSVPRRLRQIDKKREPKLRQWHPGKINKRVLLATSLSRSKRCARCQPIHSSWVRRFKAGAEKLAGTAHVPPEAPNFPDCGQTCSPACRRCAEKSRTGRYIIHIMNLSDRKNSPYCRRLQTYLIRNQYRFPPDSSRGEQTKTRGSRYRRISALVGATRSPMHPS